MKVEARVGQVWRGEKHGGFWLVISTTERTATITSCNKDGERAPGFTISARKSDLRKDYSLLPE